MATRRMFSSRVTESTKFLKMPATSQNLYFHLGMHADDDGIVEAYPVMCSIGATEDDLKILVAKNFVTILNEDIVTFINDWLENNQIRADRKIDSIYQDLLLSILPEAKLIETKPSYYLRKKICQTNDRQMTDKCPQSARLGKDSIGKDSIVNNNTSIVIPPEPEKPVPSPSGILLILNDKSLYDVPMDKIASWEEAYPDVDVKQELYKMRAWLENNPTKRKTQRGIGRFINSWLAREQDRGGSGTRQRQEYGTQKGYYPELDYSKLPDYSNREDAPF